MLEVPVIPEEWIVKGPGCVLSPGAQVGDQGSTEGQGETTSVARTSQEGRNRKGCFGLFADSAMPMG